MVIIFIICLLGIIKFLEDLGNLRGGMFFFFNIGERGRCIFGFRLFVNKEMVLL